MSEGPIDIQWPFAPCCMCWGDDSCMCTPMERALRGWTRASSTMPAMTAEQRDLCLQEIAQVEGYDRAEWEGEGDAALANGTLSAWIDYCRDKGLL